MSYNIDTIKIKRLENFIIPLNALYEGVRKDWMPEQPKITIPITNEVSITCGCGQEIKGILKEGNLHVSSLKLSGEGSGSLMREVIENAFKQSTGILEMIMIWEGGDSITKMTVLDGILEETERYHE